MTKYYFNSDVLINKLKKEITKYSQTSLIKQILYAWGCNSSKQLGLANSTEKYIEVPKVSQLPSKVEKNDWIEKIHVFEESACFVTKNKDIFNSVSLLNASRKNTMPLPKKQLNGKKYSADFLNEEKSCWDQYNYEK